MWSQWHAVARQSNRWFQGSEQHRRQPAFLYSLTKFNDTIYLASNFVFYFYDGQTIREVHSGLQPELQDTKLVDADDGVLWSIGPKDIARFDGTKWERIHHPDNPPIGFNSGSHASPGGSWS